MKPVIYSIIIVLTIVILGTFTIRMLNKESENFHNLLTDLERSIYNNKWEEANNIGKKLEKEWDNYKKVWPMLIDHSEIDNVNMLLAELESYVKSSDKTESLSKIASLKVMIKHIPKKESFIIQNIL